MGGKGSKCQYWPHHYDDWADKGQCGPFELVTYPDITYRKPNSTIDCGTDYDATPTCTPSMNLLFGAVFAPIIAVSIIVLAWYILFWRSNGSSKMHRIVAFVIISGWSFCPLWLSLTFFKDEIEPKGDWGRSLGVFLFTLLGAAITVGFILCYCGAAGVAYLCRSQPSPLSSADGQQPHGVGYGNGNGNGNSNAYAPLHETTTTPLVHAAYGDANGPEGSVAIAVATPAPSSSR